MEVGKLKVEKYDPDSEEANLAEWKMLGEADYHSGVSISDPPEEASEEQLWSWVEGWDAAHDDSFCSRD